MPILTFSIHAMGSSGDEHLAVDIPSSCGSRYPPRFYGPGPPTQLLDLCSEEISQTIRSAGSHIGLGIGIVRANTGAAGGYDGVARLLLLVLSTQ